VLVPFVKAIVTSVDIEAGTMTVTPPLGLFEDVEYSQSSVVLRPGDVLVLYTDGITEAMNAASRQFGVEQLNSVLHRCDLSAEAMRDAILEAVSGFTGGIAAQDDRTLLVAKVV